MAKAAVLSLLALAAVTLFASPAAAAGLIRVSGTDFVDESCNPFYFSGYNTWQILETAGGFCCGGREGVQKQLDSAQAANLTVVRMFAYGVQPNYRLQYGLGKYNETAFKDLDFVISEAGKRNLKLIVALASNWVYSPGTSGTKCWYTNYTTTATNCDQFYTDTNAIGYYKQWVDDITNRTNSVTNAKYSEDPTIFAWDLINEGRCDSTTCTAADIQNWVATVAPYVKSRVKQLVTVGEDGFLQASNCLSDKINPVTNSIGWPLQTGQDFVPNHAVDGIDFAAIHFWPDNWARTDSTFGANWLSGHANLSALVLKKPMIVEEFGKAFGGTDQSSGQGQTEQQQTDYYKQVYASVESSINSGGPIKGIAFWRWAEAASPTTGLASFDTSATLQSTGPTFSQVVGPFSQRVAQKTASAKVSGCTPGAATPPTTATSTTGRRLLAPAPSAGSSAAANANSLVPDSLCGAYPPQPSSVG
jgi:mannan endo-1,4-beta-mannosidase